MPPDCNSGKHNFAISCPVYYQGGLELLKGVNRLYCQSDEKVAIAYRKGAGASSTVSALFCRPESTGEIVIDDVMSTATSKANLDPFEENGDEELWNINPLE